MGNNMLTGQNGCYYFSEKLPESKEWFVKTVGVGEFSTVKEKDTSNHF
jgi:hypothetical protein